MKPIVYLAQAYSNDPQAAFNSAIFWTVQMRMKKITVLSPILHTHPYHQQLDHRRIYNAMPEYKIQCETLFFEENYVQWDLDILDAIDPKRLVLLFLPTCFGDDDKKIVSNGAKREFDWGYEQNIKMMLCYTDTQVYQAIDCLAQKKVI